MTESICKFCYKSWSIIAPSVTKFVCGTHNSQILLMSAYIKMKAFELSRTINDVFPVVKFESEGGKKYASPTTLNDIEVPNATRQVASKRNVDKVIESVVELCKTL